MTRSALYATSIVLAHLLVNIGHGLAHRELRVDLTAPQSAFVIMVVLLLPLLAMGLVWTSKKRLGFILLSLSMAGSLLFGLYHHFLASGPDHVHSQPANSWGTTFVFTAYGLFITEAIGLCIGVHFLQSAERSENPGV